MAVCWDCSSHTKNLTVWLAAEKMPGMEMHAVHGNTPSVWESGNLAGSPKALQVCDGCFQSTDGTVLDPVARALAGAGAALFA